jgi:hypothetical protein
MKLTERLDYQRKLETAVQLLAKPPAFEHIERCVPRGRLVQQFILPLELCPTTNSTRHAKGWMLAKLKKQAFEMMLWQCGGIQGAPLPGRPMVRCVRFSTVEPDKYSDWMKIAVDKLCCGPERLGYLRDDRPRDLDLHAWWEHLPKKLGTGFCLIEVYTGSEG